LHDLPSSQCSTPTKATFSILCSLAIIAPTLEVSPAGSVVVSENSDVV
jgi:hypothetical protein